MPKFLANVICQIYNLKKSSVPLSHKGLVVILIDGAGHSVIQEAIDKGYCPFLKKLMKDNEFKLHPYFCGPPASTMAAEAELFYGKSEHIPSFSWFDRRLNQFICGGVSTHVRDLETTFGQDKSTLLNNGSCVGGIYSGGANFANYSTTRFADYLSLKSFSKLETMSLLLVNPFILLFSWYIFLKNLCIGMYEMVTKRSLSSWYNRMVETLTTIFFGDYINFFSSLEIYRNTPTLFLNFSLYDWFAHWYGTRHKISFSALHLIDSYCSSLYKSMKQADRNYEMVILSDHGQNDALSFDATYKGSLEELVKAGIGDNKRNVITTYGTFMSDIKKGQDIFLIPSGSMVHLYFSESLDNPIHKAQLKLRFPQLIPTLLAHDGIGWVLVRQDKDTQVLIGKTGSLVFTNGKLLEMKGKPIQQHHWTQPLIDSLAQYAKNVNLGDVVIFGNMVENKVVAFEKYKATHGGFHGEMVWPFMLTEDKRLIYHLQNNETVKDLFHHIRNKVMI